MSFDFWLDLLIALSLFSATLFALPQSRKLLLRRSRARRLRPRLAAALEQLLAVMASPTDVSQDAEQQRQRALHLALMHLQSLISQEEVLFADEREHLIEFRHQLTQMLPSITAGAPRSKELEDFILLGQRLVSDLRENAS